MTVAGDQAMSEPVPLSAEGSGSLKAPAASDSPQIVDEHYEVLFQTMAQAFAYCRLIYDEQGAPFDWFVEDANDAFCKLVGVTDLVGKTTREMFPVVSETRLRALALFGRALDTGKPETEELYFPSGGMWLAAKVCSPSRDHFLVTLEDVSDRRRLEHALRVTRLVVDQAPEMITWVGQDGRFVYANRMACELTGYSPEEFRSLHVWDLDPSLSEPSWPDSWKETKERGPILFEGLLRGRDHHDNPVEIFTSHTELEGEEYNVAFVRDISGRKRAEQSLRDSEERYRQLFELESDAILLVDDDSGEILETNDAAMTLYGYGRAELLAMRDADLFATPEEIQSAALCPSAAASAVCHRREDGTVFPVEAHSRRFEWKGRPVHVAVVRDITDRIRAEEELEQSKQMLRLVLDTVPLRINWKDRDLRYLGCNATMALGAQLADTDAIVGLTDEELAESSAHTFLRSSLDDDRQVMQSGAPRLQFDEAVTLRDGTSRIMRTSKVPLRDRSGQIIGVLGVHEDVTGQTMALSTLKERDEQLRQSQKMEAIGRLAGGVAHDFNNVLTTIIGYSDLILSTPEASTESLGEDVREIRAAAERASGLTKQILAFSRRQALRPELLSLNRVISDTERMLARVLGADVQLKKALDANIGQVEVDEHQFVQILLNLAVNARDAMPLGGALTIETAGVELDEEFCQTHPDARPGSYVLVAVSDTGTGMDADTIAHAFEPFFTTKAKGEGTGFGLSTVYGVVAQSGGCIYVYSEVGQGTTFDIYLPRVGDPAEREREGVAASPGTRETVLVVDSEDTFRNLTAKLLSAQGYRVISAKDGDQAVAVLENPGIPIDLLLTEVTMNGPLQGVDIGQKTVNTRPGLPVLYMSAYSRDTMERSGRISEELDYLEKPFTADALNSRVRASLDSGQASKAPAP